MPVLAQAIAVVVLFEIGAEPVEAFETEGERFKLAMATTAVGVGDAFLGNAALAEARLTSHRSGVDAGRRILDHAAQQIMHHKQTTRDHRGIVAAARENAALREQAAARGNLREIIPLRPFALRDGRQSVVLGQARREMRELRIQQIGQRPVLFPDNLLEEGNRLRAHIAGKSGFPVGEMVFIRPQVRERAEVQPFTGELHGALHRARILEHPFHLRA